MPTAPYKADVHHVGLGENEASLVGLLLEGSFRRSLQPATTPASFGSGVDYLNNPQMSRWTQDDFSGGAFNYLWGEDTAMFAYCTSILPVLLGKTVRTVPPIVTGYLADDTSDIILTFIRGSVVWLIRPTEIQQYDGETQTWTSTAVPSTVPCTAAVYDSGAERLYLATDRILVRTVPLLELPGRSQDATMTIATPAVITITAHGLSVNDVIFFTTDGTLPGGITASTLYFIKEVVSADTVKLSAKKIDTNTAKGKQSDGTPDDTKAIKTTGTQTGTHTVYMRLATQEVGFVPQRPEFDFVEKDSFKTVTVMANGRAFIAAVCDGNRLFTLSIPSSGAGQPIWTDNTRLSATWTDFVVYNGVIYILCASGFNNTSIFTFDGANLVPITDFPYNFEGMCIQVYAGRVYVAGAGRDVGGIRSYAELYEITGATLRLVRTFIPEARDGGESTPFEYATAIRSMAVFEGLLYLGFDNYGVVAYDVTTDSLYGASRFQEDVPNVEIWEMLTANQTLNLWINSSDANKRGFYRIASLGEPVEPYVAQLVTSDFAPEPASDKRWSELKVVSRYGAVLVEFSVDGGTHYFPLESVASTDGSYQYGFCDLSLVPVSKHIRFRFSFERDVNSESYTELVGFTLNFLFLSSGKRTWAISVNATAIVQGKNTVSQEQDPQAIFDQLSQWAADRTALLYRDVDGTDRTVSITRFEDFKPVIGLPLDASRGLEGFYSLTLTEV